MNKKKYLIIIIIILILGGTVVSLWLPSPLQQEEEPTSASEGEPPSPDSEFAEVNLTLYNNNKSIKWALSAEEISQYEDQGLLEMVPLQIKAYQLNGSEEIIYSFEAKQGEYRNKKGLLQLDGPITIKGNDKVISLNQLTWQQKENKIVGQGPIKIMSDRFTLIGEKMVTTPSLDKIEIIGGNDQAHLNWNVTAKENDDED